MELANNIRDKISAEVVKITRVEFTLNKLEINVETKL